MLDFIKDRGKDKKSLRDMLLLVPTQRSMIKL